MAECIAYNDNGDLCRRPATVLDPARGGMVCDLHDPARQRERELVAAILAFARNHAIAPADPETNQEHERATWRAIQAAFADKWECDPLDLIDDHYTAILAAMYTPAEV